MKTMLHTLSLPRLLSTCLALAAGTFFAFAAAESPTKEPLAKPPTVGVVVLPFQNATGDDAWDDWRQSLPALVRLCLDQAEFTRISWKTIQPALVRAGWTTTTTVDAKLARQMAQELKADVVVWGSFRHLTNGWAAEAKVLRADSEAAPLELSFTSPRWVDLAEWLALGLAKELGRPMADVDRQRWRMLVTDSEPAEGSLARAIALKVQGAPVAEQEQALRKTLAADPRCGYAHASLCMILRNAERKDDWEKAVREFIRQQPQWCAAHLALAPLLSRSDDREGAEREEREVREALQLHPGCPDATQYMSALLCISQRWADLLKFIEPAHTERPHDPNITVFLAYARVQNGDLEGARSLLRSLDDLPEEKENVDIVLLGSALLTGELELRMTIS